MFSTTLFKALNSASVVNCGGYEIDAFVFDKPGLVRFDCGDDMIALLRDQPIEIDVDGVSRLAMHVDDGYDNLLLDPSQEVSIEFKVTVPLRDKDLR